MTFKLFVRRVVLAAITAFIWMSAGAFVGYSIGYGRGYKQAITDEKNVLINGVKDLYKKLK